MKAIEKAWKVTHDEATRLYDAGEPPALNDLVPIAVTTFLDGILEDPEAMWRIGIAAGDTGSGGKRWIEALKQEAER